MFKGYLKNLMRTIINLQNAKKNVFFSVKFQTIKKDCVSSTKINIEILMNIKF